VRDGRYTPTRIDVYAALNSSIFVATYEFRSRSVQIGEQDFLQFSPPTSFLPERHYAGTFTTTATTLSFQTDTCDTQFGQPLRVPTVQYTATANSLVTIAQQDGVGTVVITYVRQ